MRITLPAHPWFGGEALVLGSRGPDAVRAELPDGRTCELPLVWTDRRPRPATLRVNAQPVRLAAQALHALAAWVLPPALVDATCSRLLTWAV